MNDSPTSAPSGDEARPAPPFRMPDGPPPGTLARGAMPPEAVENSSEEPVENATREAIEPAGSDDWVVLESADGRPIESPYADESALAHAMLAPEARRSPGFSYPLEESSDDDFSDIHTGYGEAHHHASELDLDLDTARDDFSDTQLATSTGGGAAPPSIPGPTALEEHDENAPANDHEMGLVEHLGELRTRILWCVSAITLAMMVTWNYARPLEAWIIRPARLALEESKVQSNITVISPTEGFMLQFNISIISAIVLTMPFLLFQMWRFIEPAMTKRERRFTGIMVPFASLLFFMGCGLAYIMSPLFFKFFALFVPPDTLANWSFGETAELLAKMLLVCGVTFQVPVVTIFLNKSGLISRNVLIEYWRHVVVAIFIVVAVITPTWDPVSLMVCALPPCILYGLSIWLVKWLR